MSEEEKKHWSLRLLGAMIFSPINTITLLALLYFGFQAYILGNDPVLNKMIMLGIAVAWLILFLAKNLFKLILTIAVVLILFYGYYSWSRRDITACEESGGTWNAQTETCEAPQSWWQKLQNLWRESTSG